MRKFALIIVLGSAATALTGCQPAGPVSNSNSNTNHSNSVSNSANSQASNINANTAPATGSAVDTREPEKYQALVKLNFEAVGDQRSTAMPTIAAVVARSGNDRRMEFTLPNGEKVVYLDTAGSNYLILPNRRQYAELSKETLGFDVRRMMMPEQIVNQVKQLQGVERVGEDTVNGRKVIKYRYAAAANTPTQAGQVNTESYLLVDEESGLPIRSETLSQSQSGANVQGYKGLRLVTEMSDIRMEPDMNSFTVPTEFAKIDAEQVKAQANLVFSAVAAFVGQVIQQQSQPAPSPTAAK